LGHVFAKFHHNPTYPSPLLFHQVAVPDKKATIGAKLSRSLTRTAHKVEQDMKTLKRKFTAKDKDAKHESC
jgi:hypothetical protein